MTIQEAVRSAEKALADFSDAPRLDAERMALHVLKQEDASYLIAHGEEVLSNAQVKEISEMQSKRITGMPLAYILGKADFYGRTFIVTPDVLIPRPDTEALVERALEAINRLAKKLGHPLVIADVCTGSGCIAITLALELKERHRIIATDISPTALAVAKQNAEQHGILDRIEFLEGDMLEPIKNQHVDLIVSNPPYIPTKEIDAIYSHKTPYLRNSKDKPWNEQAGLLFEPRIALDGGVDGQIFVNRIQESGIPAIIETTGGEIITTNA